jgi:DNA-binding response OmpR family regulator
MQQVTDQPIPKPLLIVDDDKELCALLTERLAEDGFIVHAVHDGREGLERAASGFYSLVILDVMLPHKGGMQVLKELRALSSVPVLMLTARGEDIDRILGLEIGADDYLPKPFNPRELVARIRAILRRLDDRRVGYDLLTNGDITIDVSGREATVEGEPLFLTTVEFALLETLVRNVGRILTREYLTDIALGRKLGSFDRTIDVHISNLRKKLDDRGGNQHIKTIRGSGYLLAPSRKGTEQ